MGIWTTTSPTHGIQGNTTHNVTGMKTQHETQQQLNGNNNERAIRAKALSPAMVLSPFRIIDARPLKNTRIGFSEDPFDVVVTVEEYAMDEEATEVVANDTVANPETELKYDAETGIEQKYPASKS